MTPAQAATAAAALLPERLGPAPRATPLAGGLVNHVFRLRGPGGTAILKHAGAAMAAAPDVALDPVRLGFEARALAQLEAAPPPGPVRAPRVLAHDPAGAVLLLEDCGDAPDLGAALAEDAVPADLGAALGRFLAGLHRGTADDPWLRESHANLAIQATRREVQYAAIAGILAAADHPDAAAAGARAVELGARWSAPGRCLVMGDLWPPSLLLSEGGPRLIDWEFSHFGSPAQDLGHLAAHLWMHGHAGARPRAGRLLAEVLASYRDALGSAADALVDPGVRADAAVHMGCEVLVRAAGPFRAGYVYDGRDDLAARALTDATGWILEGAAPGLEPLSGGPRS